MGEIELLRNLHHPNIVEYIGSFKTRSHLYIIMVRLSPPWVGFGFVLLHGDGNCVACCTYVAAVASGAGIRLRSVPYFEACSAGSSA